MRFEAVADAFERQKHCPRNRPRRRANVAQALQASRDVDQVEAIAKELENRGEPVDFIKLYGFITQWTSCGVFDNTGGQGLRSRVPAGAKSRSQGHAPGQGRQRRQVVGHATPDKMGVVDLNKAIGKEKNVVAYGYAVIESPEEQPVEIRAASATALKIFVNGQEVFDRESYHQSFTTDSHIAPARLKKGKNTILVKVCQNDQKEPWAQDWKFRVRVTDALGSPVPIKVEPVELVKEGAGS